MKLTNIKTLALVTMTSSALFLTGCNTTNGGFNPNNMSTTAKGATAGAAAGALIRSGGNSKDIARGAIAGAALGGAGGYALEKYQENKNQNQQYQNQQYQNQQYQNQR
ncbi:glycine zipper domain-containing protein [Psychrobacter lutiphocae]|uniref:glycine zipper domain-containing protein n=1 Tax=Psychrobacter lutiphocae TaxID=540500 RepID=UPI000374E58C|nr:glycine zipper domain-containing protein [Psychrobacter lutiphocae]